MDSSPGELRGTMGTQLILGDSRDVTPMQPHFRWSREVPEVNFTTGGIGGVGRSRFHVSRVGR